MAHQARIGLIKKPAQTRRGVRMADIHHCIRGTSPVCLFNFLLRNVNYLRKALIPCTVTSWACIGVAALKYFDGFDRCAGRGINT
jgi:hypothetical protein